MAETANVPCTWVVPDAPCSALHCLCGQPGVSVELLECLISWQPATVRSKSSDHSHGDSSGDTPLHTLCRNAAVKPPLLQVFLRHCPLEALSEQNTQLCTPLHLLCERLGSRWKTRARGSYEIRSNEEMMTLLCEVRDVPAAVLLQDDEGRTVLHKMCSNGRVVPAKVLAAVIAISDKVVSMEDNHGRSALSLLCSSAGVTAGGGPGFPPRVVPSAAPRGSVPSNRRMAPQYRRRIQR